MENINTKTNKPKLIALILAVLGFISFLGFYLLPKLGFLQSKPDPFSSAQNIQFTPPLCEANTKKPTNIFKDVRVTHPNGQTIYFLREKGVVSGYGDYEDKKVCLNRFKPHQKVTRAEFLKMFYEIKILVEETKTPKSPSLNEKLNTAILLADKNTEKKESTKERLERLKEKEKEEAKQSFEDVPRKEWHSHYFDAAKEDGIVTQGRPGDNILRAELVTILGRQLKNHKCVPLKKEELESINLSEFPNAAYAYLPYKHALHYNVIPENTLTLPEVLGDPIDANYDEEITRAEMAEFLARLYFVLTQSDDPEKKPCIPYDEDKMWELILKDFPLPQMPDFSGLPPFGPDWKQGQPPASFQPPQFTPPPQAGVDGLLLGEANVQLSTADEILGPAITVDPGDSRNYTVTQGKSAIISFEKLPEDKENLNIGRLGQITLYGSVTYHEYNFATTSGPVPSELAIMHGKAELLEAVRRYKPEEFKDGEASGEQIIQVLNKGPYEDAKPIFSNVKNKVSADDIRGIQYELSYENDAGKFQIELKDILGNTKICITNFPFEDYGITFAIRCDSLNFENFQKIIDKAKLDRRQFSTTPSIPPQQQMDFTPKPPPGEASVQQKAGQISLSGQSNFLLQSCGISSIDMKNIGMAYMLDPGSSAIAPTVFLKGESLVIGFAKMPVQQNTVSMMRSSTEGSLTCQTYDFVANPQMFGAVNAPEFRLMMGSEALRDALKNESSFQNNASCPQTIKNTLDGTSSFSKYEISNCVNKIIDSKRGIQFNIKYTDSRFFQMLGLADATLLVTVFPFETKAASFIMKSNSEKLNDFTSAINSVQWIRIKQ